MQTALRACARARALALALALALLAPASAAVFIAAQDPRVVWAGRTELLGDGVSVRFDWPAVAAYLSVAGAGSVALNVTNEASGLNRVLTHIFEGATPYEMTRVWVQQGDSVFNVASNIFGNSSLRVFFELEPAFNGAGVDAGYVVHGFVLDAGDAVQQAHRAHRLEIVGDSISAGYGASGVGGDCPVMDYTSGNYGTYNRQICDAFGAECSVVAWSGKGMYENVRADAPAGTCAARAPRTAPCSAPQNALATCAPRPLSNCSLRPRSAATMARQCRPTTYRRAAEMPTSRTGTSRASCPTRS